MSKKLRDCSHLIVAHICQPIYQDYSEYRFVIGRPLWLKYFNNWEAPQRPWGPPTVCVCCLLFYPRDISPLECDVMSLCQAIWHPLSPTTAGYARHIVRRREVPCMSGETRCYSRFWGFYISDRTQYIVLNYILIYRVKFHSRGFWASHTAQIPKTRISVRCKKPRW